jgi:hypothetical protein
MKLVKPNSAHYKSQQKYLFYLNNIKVGDIVYPAYEAKGGRATACKVVDIKSNMLVIEGKLWASNDKVITSLFDSVTGIGWVVYKEGEPTLMDYLFTKKEDEEEGDYYRLLLPDNFTSDIFEAEYLLELGFTDIY